MGQPKRTEILKATVGSKAHGLDNKFSDTDTKSIFITPTSSFFKLGHDGGNKKVREVFREKEDTTEYELNHFLRLAISSNPTILETLKSDIFSTSTDIYYAGLGNKLRELFPYVWSSKDVLNAFRGYSHQQEKRMHDDSYQNVMRRHKFATAYFRVLLSGIELLRTGDFSVKVQDKYDCVPFEPGHDYDSWRNLLFDIKDKKIIYQDVKDIAEKLILEIDLAFEDNPNKKVEYEPINEFITKVRRENF